MPRPQFKVIPGGMQHQTTSVDVNVPGILQAIAAFQQIQANRQTLQESKNEGANIIAGLKGLGLIPQDKQIPLHNQSPINFPGEGEAVPAPEALQLEQLGQSETGRGILKSLAKATLEAQFAKPETVKDAGGFLRYLTGSQKGERVFPDVEAPQDANIAKVAPKDYTPESLRSYIQSGDPSLLVPRSDFELSQTVRDALAAMGVTNSKNITPEAIERARKKIQSEKIAVAAAQGREATLAKADAELEIPMSPTDVAKLVHPVTGKKAPMGITLQQAIDEGYQPQTAGQQGISLASKTTTAILDRVETLMEKADLADSPVDRMLGAPDRWVSYKSQANPDLVEFVSFTRGTVAPIIRALGEKGTLAEGDVGRALELMPTMWDTKEVARQKLDGLRSLLGNIDLIATGVVGRDGKLPVGEEDKADASSMSDEDLLKELGY